MKSEEEACQSCAVKPCGSMRCCVVVTGKSKQQYCLLGEQARAEVKKSLALAQSLTHPAIVIPPRVSGAEFLRRNGCGFTPTAEARTIAKMLDLK